MFQEVSVLLLFESMVLTLKHSLVSIRLALLLPLLLPLSSNHDIDFKMNNKVRALVMMQTLVIWRWPSEFTALIWRWLSEFTALCEMVDEHHLSSIQNPISLSSIAEPFLQKLVLDVQAYFFLKELHPTFGQMNSKIISHCKSNISKDVLLTGEVDHAIPVFFLAGTSRVTWDY